MANIQRPERRGSFSGSAAHTNSKSGRTNNTLFIVGAAPGPSGTAAQQQQQQNQAKPASKTQSRTPPAWLSGRKKPDVEKSDSLASFSVSKSKSAVVNEAENSQSWLNAKQGSEGEPNAILVQRSGRYSNLSAFVDTDAFESASFDRYPDSPLKEKNSRPAWSDTPVNTNTCSSLSSFDKLRLVELRRIVAARCIQRWWTAAHSKEASKSATQQNHVAVEKLLEARKRAAQSIRASNSDFVGELRAAQRNAAEERAREQRRRAIETLQEKRAEQRTRDAEVANVELARIINKQKPKTQTTKQNSDCEVKKQETAGEEMLDSKKESEEAVTQSSAIQDGFQSKTTLNDLLDTLRLLEQETESGYTRGGDSGASQNMSSVSTRIVGELDALIAETEQVKVNLNASYRQPRPLPQFSEVSQKSKRGESTSNSSRNGVDSKTPAEEPQKRATSSSKPPSSRRTERNRVSERSKANTQRSELESGSETQRSETQEGGSNVWAATPHLELDLDALAERERASRTASAISEKLLTTKIELDERTRECESLKRALAFQRELTVRNANEAQRDAERQLATAKRELEETNKRHVAFIDQLIEDKKALADRCETLVRELRTLEQRAAERFRVLEERHASETRKLKEVHEAAEKLRREKWIDEQTKRIKQLTVRGLEPEIEKLVARHKEEIRRLRAEHEAALADADQRAGERFQQSLVESRMQFERERTEAVERERRLAAERAEKQVRDELEAVAKQRERLTAEFASERERLAETVTKQRADVDRERAELQRTHAEALATLRKEFDAARIELETRSKREQDAVLARIETEQRAFVDSELRKREADFTKRELDLKERFRAERDREIEMAIERLERDSSNIKTDTERLAEQKYKRLRDKYEAEIREMEEATKQSTTKQSELKTRSLELESENDRLKVQLRQREKETEDIRKMFETLNREREHVGDIVRQEFADRIVQCEEDNKRLKAEMSEMRAKHTHDQNEAKKEIENMQRSKERELEEIHQRVKIAISKKDEVVTQLRKEHEQAVKRADHLEELLNQQRQTIVQATKKA